MQADDDITQRFRPKGMAALIVLLAAAALVVLRLIDLQIVKGNSLLVAAENQSYRTLTIPAPRGEILDSQGTVLAEDVPWYVAELSYANPPMNPAQVHLVAAILGVSASFVESQEKAVQQSAGDQAVVLETGISTEEYTALEEDLPGLPGVSVATIPYRTYPGLPGDGFPGTSLASNILGYVFPSTSSSEEIVGQAGIEKSFNGPLTLPDGTKVLGLAGTPGSEVVETDGAGHAIKVLKVQAPVAGNDVVLTINAQLQALVQRALTDQINLVKQSPVGGRSPAYGPFPEADAGAVVVIDVNTGAILAMASEPGFDPNIWVADATAYSVNPNPNSAESVAFQKQYAAWNAELGKPLVNKAISYLSPPGSTFKPITSIAALETGTITPNEHIPCVPEIQVGPGEYLHNWISTYDGDLDLAEALAFSCDTYFYQVGEATGIAAIDRVATEFGLAQPTGQTDLYGEAPGTLASPDQLIAEGGGSWTPVDTMQAAIGQSLNDFNVLEMADYVAALANGGTLYQPYLVSEVRSSSGKVLETFGPKVRNQIDVPPAIQADVRAGMEAVTEIHPSWLSDGAVSSDYWGTAYWPFYDFSQETQAYLGQAITVAAKTGTAQTGGNVTPNGWFISYAPANDPQIAVITFMQHGNEGFSSGAPIAREIYSYYFGLDKAMWDVGAGNEILPSIIRSYFGMQRPYPIDWGTPPSPSVTSSSATTTQSG